MSEPASFMVQEMKEIKNRKWSRATATVFLFKTFQIVSLRPLINPDSVIPVTGEIIEFWIFEHQTVLRQVGSRWLLQRRGRVMSH